MVRGYRTFQHWDKWLNDRLGQEVLAAEYHGLLQLLNQHFGKQALLVGTPQQAQLLSASLATYHHIVSALPQLRKGLIESDFKELPILTGSIDLVILPHALELVDHPRLLLAEACRIVKPEGLIVVCGFNPLSTWGVCKALKRGEQIPWPSKLIPPSSIRKWLELADFKIEAFRSVLYRPPLKSAGIYQRLNWIETLGEKCFPKNGSLYITIARAKVIPLTPIKLKWKQAFTGIGLPQVTRPIARHTQIKGCK